MSDNVATSTSVPTAGLPTVEEINGWSRDRVKEFLQERRADLDLEGEDIDKIYTQRVKGSTFLDFTAVDFERWGVPGSPAKEIEKLISKIKGEQPVAVLPTKPIGVAINEAKKLFNDHSHDLIKVAKNTYEPYSAFIASDKNKYKESIDKKNIPVINGRPNLLLHNLPEEGEKGLTDYDSFKKHVAESLPRGDKTIILGTSGCGKTRLCFETLCHNFGLYLIAYPYSIGSSDLEESARWTKDNITNKSSKDAEKIAVQAVISCVVGRLLLLQHLFDVAEEHNATMVPKSWLFLQLDHIIFRDLRLIFRDVTDLESVNCCSLIIKGLNDRGILKEIFPVVYDEAQAHTAYLPATFPSAKLNQDGVRAFFSVVVRSLSRSFEEISKAIICITGSGLSLLRARDEISARGKEEPHVPTFNKFGRIETSDELFELVKSIISLKEEEKEVVLPAIDWLKF
ncbi:hypothetical protein C1646_253918 [Rhizophagus diaphanus]|nr:hypothetical protein C1646_253918 [Rhizophagus diaphanus] [Rhizophagus sp. MUCL 43196]